MLGWKEPKKEGGTEGSRIRKKAKGGRKEAKERSQRSKEDKEGCKEEKEA